MIYRLAKFGMESKDPFLLDTVAKSPPIRQLEQLLRVVARNPHEYAGRRRYADCQCHTP